MTNIWRFSLVLAFSIILDQVLKGVAQGFLVPEEKVEIIFNIFFGEYKGPTYSEHVNLLLYSANVLVMILLTRSIILNRHKSFLAGLARTFILTGLFSKFLDRVTLGYLVDYLSIGDVHFTLSLAMIWGGLLLLTIMSFREKFL